MTLNCPTESEVKFLCKATVPDMGFIPPSGDIYLLLSGVWQSSGWGAIVYIAALAGIDPELHEAATIDGANRLQRMLHINLPGIMPTITTLLILDIGSLIGSGAAFEKVFLDAPPHKQYRMSFTQFRADKGIPSGSENSLLPFCANSFY